ncbi:uncharacterized protein B0T15DRAFT_251074 [Chaetomium strumarium]|uniref:Mei5 protein n=1 Tax=Chaetomium strumarium TaxID=1170767 RepID=A0AAJ0GRF7_9PEZI|nr:hypothetical protein B0T15DRAFT_251074 [Chaetomium strumarium]
MSSKDINTHAATVEALLRNLSANPSVKSFIDIADQNAKLRKENANLSSSLANQISSLQGCVDEARTRLNETSNRLNAVLKERETLATQLTTAKDKLAASEKEQGILKSKFEEERQGIEAEVREKEEELQRLGDFTVALKSVEGNEHDIRNALNAIFNAARSLADTYFGVNLPGDILADQTHWNEISAYNSNIPLPRSNSQLAKRMRVALVLSVMGQVLCKHIFQPTYLRDSPGIDNILKVLANKEPDLESHLRAVLLKTSNKIGIPDGSVSEAASQNVFDLLAPLVPEDKRKEFQTGLHRLCTMARKEWESIQTLEDLVVPELGFNRQSKRTYRWNSLPFDDPPSSSSASAPSQRTNGTTSSSQTKGAASAPGQANNSPAAVAQPRFDTAADITDGPAVWPAFLNLSYGGETLAAGFCLPLSLTKAAAEEEEQTAIPTPGSSSPRTHREQRVEERNMGTKRRRQSVAFANGQSDQGKVKGSFLSNGSGSGSRNK